MPVESRDRVQRQRKRRHQNARRIGANDRSVRPVSSPSRAPSRRPTLRQSGPEVVRRARLGVSFFSTIIQQDNQTMKRTFNRTLLLLVLLTTAFAVAGSAQNRTRAGRKAPPAQAKPKPSPTPAPSPVSTIAET